MFDSNKKQIGGDHYKSTYEHWDFVYDLKLPYMLGQVIRYVMRWKKKNGIEDLNKALHYVQKQRELHNLSVSHTQVLVAKFCDANGCGSRERLVIEELMAYHKGELKRLDTVTDILQAMLKILHTSNPVDPTFKEEGDEWRRQPGGPTKPLV